MSTTISASISLDKADNFRIVTKGGGKQRTTAYDLGQSIESNLFNAVANVAALHNLPMLPRTETIDVTEGTAKFVLG